MCLVFFIGLLHRCLLFPSCELSGAGFGGFLFFVALNFEEAGFDTPAKLAAWCPSVCGGPTPLALHSSA